MIDPALTLKLTPDQRRNLISPIKKINPLQPNFLPLRGMGGSNPEKMFRCIEANTTEYVSAKEMLLSFISSPYKRISIKYFLEKPESFERVELLLISMVQSMEQV